ncbi:hypothetical protein B0H14DRAFT_3488276 [Mycena olivaceomarginata]|nr:hypothetical protein B0H14DRAFT_3488276 [Mycena olivaceomarginata]
MVQQFGDICAFNVYLLPETSNWAGDLECDPSMALNSSVAIAYAGCFQILIMEVSPRGRFLLKLCADYVLAILNGVERFGPNSGAFTSFQGERRSVIDYVIVSKSLYPKITAFNVLAHEPTYDHAALTVELEVDASLLNLATRTPTRKRKREEVLLPDETELDKLLIQTLEAGKDDSKKILELFGPVYFQTNPVWSRFAVYARTRVDPQLLLSGGILPMREPILLPYFMLSKPPHAPKHCKNAACGWTCTNGDVMKLIIEAIQARPAPLHFVNIKRTEIHEGYNNAKLAAEKATLATSSAADLQPALPMQPFTLQPIQADKVTADVPNDSGEIAQPKLS